MIAFNKPYLTGKEAHYIYKAVYSGKISGNGIYTALCHDFFRNKYSMQKTLLTTSCTDALEMAALLLNIEPGDEVIIPSFTFVSTANAFVLRGAKIIFADSEQNTPNVDVASLESLITKKTKAIVPVHYAGVACDMDKINLIAVVEKIAVVEDAAQAIDSFYKNRPLGTLGCLSAFSFHETKNIISGEGGMLAINEPQYNARAEILWEKGTNRVAFSRGEINKYNWVDVGSSFLPSEIIAAFLYAQLEHIEQIQARRIFLWNRYKDNLESVSEKFGFRLPYFPSYATNNAHAFFIVISDSEKRNDLIKYLAENDILAVFHYLPLHRSPFYANKHDGRVLKNADMFSNSIVRLPLYYELELTQVDYVCDRINTWFKLNK